MMIDRAWLHDASFNLLYACLVLATFVILERGIMYLWLTLCRRRIAQAIRSGGAEAALELATTNPIGRAIREFVIQQQKEHMTRNRAEDVSAALFLDVDGRVQARLWILDTVVTAAPLLGLLGTILGIMETFSALSSGGISDPAAVSRDIATALLATAIGIGTALYGLIGHNVLHRAADHLIEGVKSLLLQTTIAP
jgi:biopolymer transport protein ExbB